MNDNTIDLAAAREKLNKPVTRTIKHVDMEVESEPETTKDANLKMLRDARRLVEDDKLEGLIIVGRATGTQIFHTNHALHSSVIPPEQIWAFIGVLHGLTQELTDLAMTQAKELLADGTFTEHDDFEEFAD